jgi:adenosine deaminase
MNDVEAFVRGMPKCELHVHLEGTLEAEMKFEFARRNGITLPYADVAAMKAAYVFDDLPSFLKVYYEGLELLHTEADFHDLCLAYLHKARAQNVRHAEMFFDPQAHTSRGVAFDAVLRGLRRAQVEGEEALGIQSQLIMCFMRERSAEEAMATLLAALPYKDWIVGVGLDSYEPGNPPRKFAQVFARAREEGFRLTMHCDVNQPDTHEHIRQALAEVGVDRIDHGVNVLDDPSLIALARQRQTAFTFCPFVNQTVLGDEGQQPVRSMLERGLLVTLNSDDPAYMQGLYVNENWLLMQRSLGLSTAELLHLARNGFEAAWLPQAERERGLAELDAYAGRAIH